MNFLVVACTLAFVSATHTNQQYKGPKHIPILNIHGVPIDTLEVQQARADHLNHLATAKSAYGNSRNALSISHENVPKYQGPQHVPIIGKLGVPIDTKEVQHARTEHFSHKAQIEANIAEKDSSEEDSASSEEDYEDFSSEEDSSEESLETKYGMHYVPVIFSGVPEVTAEVKHGQFLHPNAYKQAGQYFNY